MERTPFNSMHTLRRANQGTGDGCNSAAPTLPAMQYTGSVNSSGGSNTQRSLQSSQAEELNSMHKRTMQTKIYEALRLAELDMEIHAGLLAQNLHRSRITDGYPRVQESIPAMAYDSVTGFDPYNSRIPINPCEFEHGTTNNSPHRRSYGHRYHHHGAMQHDYSFSSSKVPLNSKYDRKPSCYSRNSVATTTSQVDHVGNGSSVLLDLLSDNGDVFETMKSKHGNYTFQNFLTLCNEEQKKDIVVRVSKDPRRLVEVATDSIGRYSFKKLIAVVSTSPKLCEHLMYGLSPELLNIMIRPKGGPGVIKDLLDHLQPNHTSPIFKVALEHFNLLSKDETGCISLKNCFSKCCKFEDYETSVKSHKWLLLMKLIDSSLELATDGYGNFIVQHVVLLGISEYTTMICNKLKDNIHQLSLSKYGSFVLQRCFESSERMIILKALVSCETQALREITMHPYGNYVMQSAMKVLKELPLDDKLVQAMRQLPADIKHQINARNMVKRK